MFVGKVRPGAYPKVMNLSRAPVYCRLLALISNIRLGSLPGRSTLAYDVHTDVKSFEILGPCLNDIKTFFEHLHPSQIFPSTRDNYLSGTPHSEGRLWATTVYITEKACHVRTR
jgi:hypothetical protein